MCAYIQYVCVYIPTAIYTHQLFCPEDPEPLTLRSDFHTHGLSGLFCSDTTPVHLFCSVKRRACVRVSGQTSLHFTVGGASIQTATTRSNSPSGLSTGSQVGVCACACPVTVCARAHSRACTYVLALLCVCLSVILLRPICLLSARLPRLLSFTPLRPSPASLLPPLFLLSLPLPPPPSPFLISPSVFASSSLHHSSQGKNHPGNSLPSALLLHPSSSPRRLKVLFSLPLSAQPNSALLLSQRCRSPSWISVVPSFIDVEERAASSGFVLIFGCTCGSGSLEMRLSFYFLVRAKSLFALL